MPGVWTIARKEFRDHVSDRTFLLCFAALLITMVGGALYFVQWINDFDWGWKYWYVYLIEYVTRNLSSIGVLVAIALSFNSINKERTEGSLKVLLSYPIYRDKIILGKILAGFLVITIVTIASMTISFSIVVYYLSIPLTADFLLRVVAMIAMGIVLLTFFLCVGTAVSTILQDTSTIVLSLLLISALLQYQNYKVIVATALYVLSFLGYNFIEPGFFTRSYFRMWYDDPFYLLYSKLSPVESYLKLSERLFYYGKPFERFSGVYSGSIFTTFQEQLYGNLDLVAIPILYTVAAFIASYILFTRREIA